MAKTYLSVIVANWLVEDQSFLARGADPTWVGKFELTSVFGQTLVVEEFQGFYYVSVGDERVFCHNHTDHNTARLDRWLEALGAPTMTMIYDALAYAEDKLVMERVDLAELDADYRMLGWAY